MNQLPLNQASAPFLEFLDGWMAVLPAVRLVDAAPFPEKTALLCVDVTNGFCYAGALSSPRVEGIVAPITNLMKNAWAHGVRNFILSQDTHDPEAIEFAQWPPHCVRGSVEAETVDAIKNLPFFADMLLLEKNSIHSGLNTGLNEWLAAHPAVDTFIVTGDCTDLCTYQLAMHLRLDANHNQRVRRVIVPADCVQTYDRTVETAQAQGGLPHPGDLLHALFLYHMQLNGIEITAQLVA